RMEYFSSPAVILAGYCAEYSKQTLITIWRLIQHLQVTWHTAHCSMQLLLKSLMYRQSQFKLHFCNPHFSLCLLNLHVMALLGDGFTYFVLTAVTEFGNGKLKFYSTLDIIAFGRKWRLPTNHVWLFSTTKSVSSFFAAYDALCEEGTGTSVCKALDEVADISVP
ncbi:hypothetical protein MKW94_021953, partial [Papaver nudicaule]|nr:hypothetical protein [Papaver nudicaule]